MATREAGIPCTRSVHAGGLGVACAAGRKAGGTSAQVFPEVLRTGGALQGRRAAPTCVANVLLHPLHALRHADQRPGLLPRRQLELRQRVRVGLRAPCSAVGHRQLANDDGLPAGRQASGWATPTLLSRSPRRVAPGTTQSTWGSEAAQRAAEDAWLRNAGRCSAWQGRRWQSPTCFSGSLRSRPTSLLRSDSLSSWRARASSCAACWLAAASTRSRRAAASWPGPRWAPLGPGLEGARGRKVARGAMISSATQPPGSGGRGRRRLPDADPGRGQRHHSGGFTGPHMIATTTSSRACTSAGCQGAHLLPRASQERRRPSTSAASSGSVSQAPPGTA